MAGKDLNTISITGRLGKAPEMRYAPSGDAVLTIGVAVSRGKVKDGQQDTDWFDVTLWGKAAEIVNEYATKGSRMAFTGRLQTRSWDDSQTGEKRYRTEIKASDFVFLDGKPAAHHEPADDYQDEEPEPAPPPRQQQPVRAPRPTQPAQRPVARPAPAPRSRVVLEEADLPDSLPF